MTRVLIADDQALVRTGFKMILTAAGIDVVGEAADGLEAVELARALRPDVILMDIRMPELDGLAAARRVLADAPQTRVIMLTTFDLDKYVYAALAAGASGFLLKDASRGQLAEAVRTVHKGDALLAPAITKRLIEDFCRGPAPGANGSGLGLSERELEVCRLVARGMSNGEIAAQLYVSEATVKTHVAHVLSRLGLRDRVQVTVFAYEHGIVRPGRGA